MKKKLKLTHSKTPENPHGFEKKQQSLREQIRDAFFVRHWSRDRIRCFYRVSNRTVLRWSQSATQDCTIDHRGWPKGMKRTHTAETLTRIRQIHDELSTDPAEFFTGASAIEREWTMRFAETAPPLRTIGALLKEMHLSTSRKKGRGKGAAAYLHYPEHTIYHGLDGRLIEADFIGRKSFTGQSAPLCFMSFSAKLSPKIRAFQRVTAETADAFIASGTWFFAEYEEPDFLKLDNSATLIGSASGKRTISRVARFLLQRQIVPIYAVPRKPFTQASVEGSNSMFARKFWNARRFTSLEEVDTQLGWFNAAIGRYHGYKPCTRTRLESFVPRMYFIRQVHESPERKGFGWIDVQHEDILLPLPYVKYFVLAEWNLETQRLMVHFESDKKLTLLHEQTFRINGKKFEF